MNAKKFIFHLVLLLFFSTLLPAQSLTWQKVFRRNNDYVDNSGYDICPLSDGKFLALSYFESPQGAYVIKINEYGAFLDSIFIPGHYGYSCAPTPDDGLVTIGNRFGIFAMKINSSCRVDWLTEYSNTENMNCWKTIRTDDNYYLGVGGGGNFEGVLAKIDANGSLIWQKFYPAGYAKEFLYVSETTDRNYLCVGWALDSQFDVVHGIIDKIDTSGTLMWEKRIDNVRNKFSIGRIKNQYILGVCFFDSITSNQTAGFIRIDSLGNILKQVRLLRDANYSTIHKDLKILGSNKFMFVNYRLRNTYDTLQAYVVITDSTGNVLNTKLFPSNVNSLLEKGYILNNGYYVFIGSSNHLYTGFDNIYIVKTDSSLSSPPVGISGHYQIIPVQYYVSEPYPNPFNGQTEIKIALPENTPLNISAYDIIGRKINTILNDRMKAGYYTIKFNGEALSSGIYFLRITARNFSQTKKIFLVK